jgi:hypothetical protein
MSALRLAPPADPTDLASVEASIRELARRAAAPRPAHRPRRRSQPARSTASHRLALVVAIEDHLAAQPSSPEDDARRPTPCDDVVHARGPPPRGAPGEGLSGPDAAPAVGHGSIGRRRSGRGAPPRRRGRSASGTQPSGFVDRHEHGQPPGRGPPRAPGPAPARVRSPPVGLRAGERVALVLPTAPAFLDAIFSAAMLLGAVPVAALPARPPRPPRRVLRPHRGDAAGVSTPPRSSPTARVRAGSSAAWSTRPCSRGARASACSTPPRLLERSCDIGWRIGRLQRTPTDLCRWSSSAVGHHRRPQARRRSAHGRRCWPTPAHLRSGARCSNRRLDSATLARTPA